MFSLGALTFLNAWVLAGLLALPVLWWLLRAIPPLPKTQVFGGVRLLLGLEDEDRQSDKTPWWLLLLRIAAIAAAFIGFSQPVLNLEERLARQSGPLLVVFDQGWASAPDWTDRMTAARTILEEAAQADRPVLVATLADGALTPMVSAGEAQAIVQSLAPRPWPARPASVTEALASLDETPTETVWFHDGLAQDLTQDLLGTVSDFGPLRLVGPVAPAYALTPPRLVDGRLEADVLRAVGGEESVDVITFVEAEGGGERRYDVSSAVFGADDESATVQLRVPPERIGAVTRIQVASRPSAGGAALADGAIRRVKTGIVALASDATVTTLVSPTHYVEKALVPWADSTLGGLMDLLETEPSALISIDQGDISDEDRTALTEWVEAGGLLVRFAGPRLAASIGAQGFGMARNDDPLLPVRLRRGGRVLGGALAWSTPRTLGPFDPDGPFRGLTPPVEVDVRSQVLAEPSPDLDGKVWATLDDGTPLVTASRLGDGYVVLFHVSSDAEWSSLPLSGLFVDMLGRLMTLAPGKASEIPDAEDLVDTVWRADTLMDATGNPTTLSGAGDPVIGEIIATGEVGPRLPPGIYIRADGGARAAGEANALVVNVTAEGDILQPFPPAPAGAVLETLGAEPPMRYGPWLIAMAALLALADVIATLFVSGRLARPKRLTAAAVGALVLLGVPEAPMAEERPDLPLGAVSATAETTLGYVITGDARTDEKSERGVTGLGAALTRLTAIEPGPPVGVRPGEDALSFYAVLYWPLSGATIPDPSALAALSEYIRTGGMLIIDTQNGASGFGGASAVQMRQIARALNLPPLAPVDQTHVLTRTFYLLNSFPGRWRGDRVWVEAPSDRAGAAPEASGIPQFDRVDDNVSPVIVGSADWAAAWAIDARGQPMFPVGRPGDRQREMAYRFGVNAVMYALTGNYKSDQVHAPAVLQRLGQ